MYMAVQKNNLEIVSLLADAGTDLDRAAKEGTTPAFIAAQLGHLEVLGLLADKGVSCIP